MFLISGLAGGKEPQTGRRLHREVLSCTAGTMSFVGQGVAARAAYQASQRAHVEWVNGGERGPGPAPFAGMAEAASRRGSGGNYVVRRQREGKKKRKQRLEAYAANAINMSAVQIATRKKREEEQLAEALMPLARAGPPTPSHRQPSLVVNTILDRPLLGEAESPPVGDHLVKQLADISRRWYEFKQEMAATTERAAAMSVGMAEGFPSWQLTAKFGQYLLTTRCTRDHASRRAGKAPSLGRKGNSVAKSLVLLQVSK